MAGFPHDRSAAQFFNFLVKNFRGFHFRDDRSSWISRKYILREEDHEEVTPDNVPLIINGSNPVSVSIIGYAQMCF